MNGVWRWAPSRNMPECQSKSGFVSRKSASISSSGSARQASPRLNGPRPMPSRSSGSAESEAVRDDRSRGVDKGLSQVLLGVAGYEVEDGGDVGRLRLGV